MCCIHTRRSNLTKRRQPVPRAWANLISEKELDLATWSFGTQPAYPFQNSDYRTILGLKIQQASYNSPARQLRNAALVVSSDTRKDVYLIEAIGIPQSELLDGG